MEYSRETVKNILAKRIVVSAGKHSAKVTSVTLNHMREDGTMVNIVNLSACTPHQLGIAKEAYMSGRLVDAIGKGTSLSASLRLTQYCPTQGEKVDFEVEEVVNKEGIDILVVNSIIKRQVEKASTINLDDWDEVEDKKAGKATKEEALA